MSLSYEEGKKVVLKGLILLGIITIVEVIIALLGNGHLIEGFKIHHYIMYPIMIGLSLYKAYFIVYEFMHMKYEFKTLALSVLLPLVLLFWAIIAFLYEGNAWKENRQYVNLRNEINYKVLPPIEKAEASMHSEEGHSAEGADHNSH